MLNQNKILLKQKCSYNHRHINEMTVLSLTFLGPFVARGGNIATTESVRVGFLAGSLCSLYFELFHYSKH